MSLRWNLEILFVIGTINIKRRTILLFIVNVNCNPKNDFSINIMYDSLIAGNIVVFCEKQTIYKKHDRMNS